MLNLSPLTQINKPLPKKAIYEKLQLNTSQQKSIDADISRMVLVNELSTRTTNIAEGTEIKSIFVLSVTLKQKHYSQQNIRMLFKLIPQKIVLVLNFEYQEQVTVFYRNKIIQTSWNPLNNKSLKLEGLNLDEVWKNIILQVGEISLKPEETLDEQIKINEFLKKIEKQIAVLEKKVFLEKQPKKKLALFNELQELKQKIRIK